MTNSTRDHECDVAIVGAGIGGLATCAALTTRYPGISISLFDAAATPGGRIRSKRYSPRSGPRDPQAPDVFELGAGRYHQTNHPRLHALVTSLGLRTHTFSYTMHRVCPCSQSDDVAASLHKLQALESSTPSTVSFRSAASAALGDTVFESLVQMSGYDTLRCDDLPFEYGLGILSGHPETRSIWSTDWSDWRALTDGFSALTAALADKLSARQQLFFRHRASRLTALPTDAVQLEVGGPDGRLLVSAKQVICATSLFDFLALYPTAIDYVDYARHVVDVPLLKGYVQYDRAWWPQQEDEAAQVLGRCLVVPGDFRKVYLSASRPSLFFYCDGSSAIALRQRLRDRTAPALLAEDLGRHFSDVASVAVQATDWKFWDRGVSFWANGIQQISDPVWQPAPNVFLQTDINTSALGWIEGALIAAEVTVDEVSRGGGTSAVRKMSGPARRRDVNPVPQEFELA